jgi:acyl carrier protein
VDLGEVEAVIRSHPSVRDVTVVAREEQNDGRLIAYVVLNKGELSTTRALQLAAAAKLPQYMIPTRFLFLDALPLTPNGKVDKRALPDPGRSRPDLDTPFVGPRDTIESELVKILTEILPVDRIGIHDDFFDLGGHSLAAARLISLVMDRFGVQLPLRSLFESANIAAMGSLIAQSQEENVGRVLGEVESVSDEEAQKLVDTDNS